MVSYAHANKFNLLQNDFTPWLFAFVPSFFCLHHFLAQFQPLRQWKTSTVFFNLQPDKDEFSYQNLPCLSRSHKTKGVPSLVPFPGCCHWVHAYSCSALRLIMSVYCIAKTFFSLCLTQSNATSPDTRVNVGKVCFCKPQLCWNFNSFWGPNFAFL